MTMTLHVVSLTDHDTTYEIKEDRRFSMVVAERITSSRRGTTTWFTHENGQRELLDQNPDARTAYNKLFQFLETYKNISEAGESTSG